MDDLFRDYLEFLFEMIEALRRHAIIMSLCQMGCKFSFIQVIR
jgi:poly-beta-hydroxyalkanoate depolymerase